MWDNEDDPDFLDRIPRSGEPLADALKLIEKIGMEQFRTDLLARRDVRESYRMYFIDYLDKRGFVDEGHVEALVQAITEVAKELLGSTGTDA